MRKLEFHAEEYIVKDGVLRAEDELVGVVELLWSAIDNSPCKDLTKKEHKINKRLKKALKSISTYKDKDEDSRVALAGPQTLIIEEDEYELLKKLVEANTFFSRVSDIVSELWDVIDNAALYTPPQSIKEG